MKKELTSATKLIYEMLTTNTGSHFLDSGSAYGRNWERNQVKKLQDFRKESSVTWDDGYYRISLFHYLNSQLELDSICKKFNKIPVKEYDYDYGCGVCTEGGKYLESLNAEFGNSWNSYNGDSSLSQVIQGQYITINDKYYVLLQIHQGCDVRGGYTDAKLFRIVNDFDGFLCPEDVYGYVEKPDGTKISVDNSYDGYNLTNESGNIVEITKDDKVVLWLSYMY